MTHEQHREAAARYWKAVRKGRRDIEYEFTGETNIDETRRVVNAMMHTQRIAVLHDIASLPAIQRHLDVIAVLEQTIVAAGGQVI